MLLCVPVLALGCGSQEKTKLVVYAASSLTEAMSAVGVEFEARHPDVQVVFNFAGSQALATQIEHGAVADVFAPADVFYMQRLQQAELVLEDPVILAHNRLIVALPAANPAGLRNLQDLARSDVRIVVAQQNVPVGRYTRQVIANLSTEAWYGSGFREAVLANVRSEELNVRQVLAKVALGEADAGFVYVSDVASAQKDVITLDIPKTANVTAAYPIALLATTEHEDLARHFLAFVQSPAAREILQRAGFQAVDLP
jgi:molybdate transport system substrate-binding protein